jgi:hypothetical protein
VPLIKKNPALFLVPLAVLLAYLCIDYAGATSIAPPPAAATATAMPEYTILSAPETDIPLRLKISAFKKPQMVHLDSEVGEVAVDGMPIHVTAVKYDGKSIALFPRSPGVSHITVFGKNGAPIMARYVIVADPAKKYIRLRLTCKKETDAGCRKSAVYFCPNLCYETRLVGAAAYQLATSK